MRVCVIIPSPIVIVPSSTDFSNANKDGRKHSHDMGTCILATTTHFSEVLWAMGGRNFSESHSVPPDLPIE